MRAVIQRVTEASVSISGEVYAAIGQGFLILLGIATEDTEQDIDRLVKKVSGLRVFADEAGKMNLNISQVKGEILLISQFTLMASVRKGNRPSFTAAARPEQAIPLYERTIDAFNATLQTKVKTGVFGADMQVSLCNDGPVTIIVDTKE